MNVAVFIVMLRLPDEAAVNTFFAAYAMYPHAVVTGMPVTANSIEPVYLTIFTSMFLHGGFLHIIFNMLFLWIFGNNIEDALGRVKFLVFYFATGVAGAIAHILTDPNSVIPTVGASGAISGILGAYLILYPTRAS
jgi:membrane associated rhomboid family serine protease